MSASPMIELRPRADRKSPTERAKLMQSLGFGQIFTEHMVKIPYRAPVGWGPGVLEAYGRIELDPAATVLHYGQAIFEGFKAYRQKDGGVATFRPDANARRFNASARRLAMPEMPVELFIEAADALVRHERQWVPAGSGESLYLRPLMIATESGLGVRPATQFLFLLFGSPSGAYFPQGVKPVTVWISQEHSRAAPGGTGAAKCAGNYAASLVAQEQAQKEGCDQVVWLDACQHNVVEEMGGMNLFFVYEERGRTVLVTPKLTGTLLPGITRDSLLVLGRDLGYEIDERTVTVDEWQAALADRRMTEVFACGTAAVITPVARVRSKRGEWVVGSGETGPVAVGLREALLAIQHGEATDVHRWMHRVC